MICVPRQVPILRLFCGSLTDNAVPFVVSMFRFAANTVGTADYWQNFMFLNSITCENYFA